MKHTLDWLATSTPISWKQHLHSAPSDSTVNFMSEICTWLRQNYMCTRCTRRAHFICAFAWNTAKRLPHSLPTNTPHGLFVKHVTMCACGTSILGSKQSDQAANAIPWAAGASTSETDLSHRTLSAHAMTLARPCQNGAEEGQSHIGTSSGDPRSLPPVSPSPPDEVTPGSDVACMQARKIVPKEQCSMANPRAQWKLRISSACWSSLAAAAAIVLSVCGCPADRCGRMKMKLTTNVAGTL